MDVLGLFLIFSICIVVVTPQIAPCELTSPSIVLSIEEATSQDILSDPHRYEAAIGIQGVLNGSDPASGIQLYLQNSPSRVDVNRLFVLEKEQSVNNPTQYPIPDKILLRLIEPLDRDGATFSPLDDLDIIEFTIKCTRVGSTVAIYHDAKIEVVDVNDNRPEILGTALPISVNEALPVDGTVGELIRLMTVVDKDEGSNRQVSYGIVSTTDGVNTFKMTNVYRGTLVLTSPLDFEQGKSYTLNVSVTDQALEETQRHTIYTLVNIMVTDADDLGPVFDYPGCLKVDNVCFNPTYTTTLEPYEIKMGEYRRLQLETLQNPNMVVRMIAKDQDALNLPIGFTIPETIPSGYENKFIIATYKSNGGGYEGRISQKSTIERDDISSLYLIIKATERSENKRFYRAIIHASLGPSNNSYSCRPNSEASEPSGNNTLLVGGVLGVLLALAVAVIVVLIVIIIKQRRTEAPKESTQRSHHENQHEGTLTVHDRGANPERHQSKKYEDIGMRSPDNVYDQIQHYYIEPCT